MLESKMHDNPPHFEMLTSPTRGLPMRPFLASPLESFGTAWTSLINLFLRTTQHGLKVVRNEENRRRHPLLLLRERQQYSSVPVRVLKFRLEVE